MEQPLDDKSRARAHVDAERVWRVLTMEPGAGIALIRADGLVIYANRAMCEIWTPSGEDTMELTGRNIAEWYGPERTAELLSVIKARHRERCFHCASSNLPRPTDQVHPPRHGGAPRRAGSRPGGVSHYFSDEIVAQGEHAEYEVEDAPYADFGPLDVLTRRGFEVLALLGQGFTVNEVAKMIFRLPETVENHRLSIGRKLKVSNHVQLAKLAFRAGLRVDDARLKRV